ncbi:hypothetical protein [Dyella sp. C9]|uniref:hypothetical protein n=1 Tax=Dyella sp. C9 TaxID=2202154 RepID=UPI000DF00D24|nr:hypothetical protein [Dyella sp. C9]
MTSVLLPVVLVGLMGDVPLSLVIVALCHPTHPWLVHALIAAFGLYAVGWALAARSVVAAVPHVIDDHQLWIGGSIRHSGKLPRGAMVRAVPVQGSRHAWAATQGVAMRDTLRMSELDPPNLAIELDAGAMTGVELLRNGKPLPPRRWLLLYADHPSELVRLATRKDATALAGEAATIS